MSHRFQGGVPDLWSVRDQCGVELPLLVWCECAGPCEREVRYMIGVGAGPVRSCPLHVIAELVGRMHGVARGEKEEEKA